MKMPIPNDWDNSTFCNFLVRWPESTLWRIILRGLISNPALEAFWDERTGDVADVIEAFSAALDQNLDELECTNMNIPVGTIWLYAGTEAPPGWLFCNGQRLSSLTYPDLFSVIGLTYGGVGVDSLFDLPNLKGRVAVGLATSGSNFTDLGETGGEVEHALTTDEMPAHTHTQNSHDHTQNSHNHTQDSHNHIQNSHDHTVYGGLVGATGAVQRILRQNPGGGADVLTVSATATNQAATAANQAATAINQAATATNQDMGGGLPHNNLQPYLVLNYIIRVEP